MAFSYVVLRPGSKSRDDGFMTIPSGSAVSVTTDNSDTTYMQRSNTSSAMVITFNLTDPSPAEPQSGTFVRSVQVLTRCQRSTTGVTTIGLGTSDDNSATNNLKTTSGVISSLPGSIVSVSTASRAAGGIVTLTTGAAHGLAIGNQIVITGNTTGTPSGFLNGTWTVLTVPSSTQITFQHTNTTASTGAATNGTVIGVNVTSAPATRNPNGNTWSQTNVTNLVAYIADRQIASGLTKFYEVLSVLEMASLPTVSIASIDGDTSAPYSVTTTTRPSIAWTYAQAESLSQIAWQVKVFTTDPGAGGAETATALWSASGTDSSSSTTLTTDLVNGTTYYVYVKVGTGDSTAPSFSTWVGSAFSVSLTAPTTPTISSATWSAANQRTTVTVTGSSFATGSQTWDLQRSNDGGTTWVYVRGAVSGNSTAAGVSPSTWTVYDYEPVRGTTARYRVRSVGTVSGQTIASAWSSATTVSITAVSAWHLMAFTSTALSGSVLSDVKVLGDLDLEQEESVGVFRPEGRTRTIVVHGALTGEDGSYNLLAQGIAARDALLAVINSQRTVLVVDPFGEQKYVRFFGTRGMRQTGASTDPRFYLSVSYAEVDSGLVAG